MIIANCFFTLYETTDLPSLKSMNKILVSQRFIPSCQPFGRWISILFVRFVNFCSKRRNIHCHYPNWYWSASFDATRIPPSQLRKTIKCLVSQWHKGDPGCSKKGEQKLLSVVYFKQRTQGLDSYQYNSLNDSQQQSCVGEVHHGNEVYLIFVNGIVGYSCTHLCI